MLMLHQKKIMKPHHSRGMDSTGMAATGFESSDRSKSRTETRTFGLRSEDTSATAHGRHLFALQFEEHASWAQEFSRVLEVWVSDRWFQGFSMFFFFPLGRRLWDFSETPLE